MRALVVEDDLKSQCLLAKVLAERGHEVTTFENAEQAILACQKEFYPLLFVDVDLPGMNGLQFCRWIRSQPLGEGTYVIAAIEPSIPAEVKQVLAAGANDFLTKPYQLDQLRARLTIGERQMAQFFEQQQLEESLHSETQRWSLAEAALVRTQQEFEATLKAKEAELGELREKLSSSSTNRELVESLESKLAKRDEDLEHLREEIGDLWQRAGRQERALEESKRECETGQVRWREAERALDSANRELKRLRNGEAESADSVRESLRSRDEELTRLRQELIDVRQELGIRLRTHTEELIRFSDQMRMNLEDRKKVESDLAATHDELTCRGREHVEESATLRRAVAEANEQVALRERDHQAALEEVRLHRDARERLETRWRVMVRLGPELNQAGTVEGVARVAGRVTQELVGWDFFSLDTYVAEGDWIHPVLSLEHVEGISREAGPMHPGPHPTSLMRRVLEDGPQLILRPATSSQQSGAAVADSRTRLSASWLCVPVVMGQRTVGFLSIRSSLEHAYHVEDMETLQMVAAQSAGAFERIEARLEREDDVVVVPAAVSAVAAEADP